MVIIDYNFFCVYIRAERVCLRNSLNDPQSLLLTMRWTLQSVKLGLTETNILRQTRIR